MSVNVYFYNDRYCKDEITDTVFHGIGHWNRMGEAWMEVYQGGLYAYEFPCKIGYNIQAITVRVILSKWKEFEKEINKCYPKRGTTLFQKIINILTFNNDWKPVWYAVKRSKKELEKLPKNKVIYVDAG